MLHTTIGSRLITVTHIAETCTCRFAQETCTSDMLSSFFGLRIKSHIATHLVLLLVWVNFSYKLRQLESDQDEIWQHCSSSKYASIDGVIFLIWCHNFKMAVKTSFNAQKCCHLVSALPCSYAAASASSWSIVHPYLFVYKFLDRIERIPCPVCTRSWLEQYNQAIQYWA